MAPGASEGPSATWTSIWPWPKSMDGVIAAPEVFHVLFENDRVRVVGVRIEAGQRVTEHTHRRPSVVVVEQPAMLRYHTDVHLARDVEPVAMADDDAPGDAVAGLLWSDPVGPHVVENVDDHAFHAVRIELKDAAEVPQRPG